jgi:hypothetical protein
MTVHIGRLSLRLPAGYGASAESIGRSVADGIAQLRATESRSLPALHLDPVRIAPGASNAQVVAAILRHVAAALELQA